MMGISPFHVSDCGCCEPFVKKEAREDPPKVPDPSQFNILRLDQIGEWTVAEVMYHEAVNYEGKKIMVYRASRECVSTRRVLDPHFCDGKHLSPFARFEPTEQGWDAAIKLVRLMQNG